MPLIKKKFAPKRKMVRRKLWARKPRSVTVNRALQPVAQRYICKMKYAEVVTTDTNGMFIFNLNSTFDPNRTGVGHQPYGRDTLASLYNRYRVISCSYRISMTGNYASGTPVQIAAVPSNEVQTFVTGSDIRENPRARYIVQNPSAAIKYLSGKVYCPSIVGRSKFQYMADDRYQAQVDASPNELILLNIGTSQLSDLMQPNTQLAVMLEYTVEWFDVKTLTQS